MTQLQSYDGYNAAPGALLIGARYDCETLAEAAAAAGVRIAGTVGWEDVPAALDAPVAIAIAALGDIPSTELPTLIAPLAGLAEAVECGLVVTMRHDQIDPAAAALLGTRTELLCDPDAPALAASIAMALARFGNQLADRVREGEAERLRRLNDEVARIADVLTRLTRNADRRAVPGLADHGLTYDGSPAAVDVNSADIRKAIRARRLRDVQFPGGMFEDPAWDMLLDLYAAGLEGVPVSVSSLCIAAAVAPTTALRWIGRMTEAGLFDRQPDPFDRRRAFMALSDVARERMDRYFAMLSQNGLTIV